MKGKSFDQKIRQKKMNYSICTNPAIIYYYSFGIYQTKQTFSRVIIIKTYITFQTIWSIKVLKRDKRKSFTRTSDESWVAVKNFYVMCFRGYDDRVQLRRYCDQIIQFNRHLEFVF